MGSETIASGLTTNPVDGMSETIAMDIGHVSNVTDMSNAFENRTTFNADISTWNVSMLLIWNMQVDIIQLQWEALQLQVILQILAHGMSSVINMERMFYNVDNLIEI